MFITHPRRFGEKIVLSLLNWTPEDGIEQIKEKEYFNSLGDYKRDILLLGINYGSITLKRSSKVEIIKL